jgi:death on curing protein
MHWVTDAALLAIHDEQLAEHGGLPGIRDINLLESALARSRQLEAYGDRVPDIAALAASYAFGMAKNHAFLDGNKRTSFVVTRVFLILNGYDIVADDLNKLKVWLSLSDGSMSENDCAEWLRANIGPIECLN